MDALPIEPHNPEMSPAEFGSVPFVDERPQLSIAVNETDKTQGAQWDNFEFEFSRQNVYGGNIAATPESRGRSIIHSVMDVVPESVPEIEGKTFTGNLQKARRKFYSSVEIDGSRETVGHVVDASEITEKLRVELVAQNHPIMQLIRLIEKDNEARRTANNTRTINQENTLSDGDIERMTHDAIMAAFPDTINKRVNAAIRELRKQLKAIKQGGAVVATATTKTEE